ncbi:hypothetical protein D3C86_1245630 [compost metagenome]
MSQRDPRHAQGESIVVYRFIHYWIVFTTGQQIVTEPQNSEAFYQHWSFNPAFRARKKNRFRLQNLDFVSVEVGNYIFVI